MLNKIFYIRELVYDKIVNVRWIQTKMNPADLGTKALGASAFRLSSSFIMNDSIDQPSRPSGATIRGGRLCDLPRFRRR